MKGYTRTEPRSTTFSGFWWSSKRRQWIRDKIVLCIVDYKIDFGNPRLPDMVKELKSEIHKAYEHFQRKQEEVWVVAHTVFRQD